MPTFGGISVSLLSQFDVLRIPEYPPPSFSDRRTSPNDGHNAHAHSREQADMGPEQHEKVLQQTSISSFETASTLSSSVVAERGGGSSRDGESVAPSALAYSPKSPVVEVYTPTYPGSQFWISYAASKTTLVPVAAAGQDMQQLPAATATGFLYFKLFVDGTSVVSWGVGENQGWKGKTMWGLCKGSAGAETWEGFGTLEKRGLFFAARDEVSQEVEGGACLEIRVYRARGRKRVDCAVKPLVNEAGKETIE